MITESAGKQISPLFATFCGHSAVLLECAQTTVAIDPWLEGNPLCPEAHKNPKSIDIIALTHGHADHAGDAVRLAKRYGSKVCATWELASLLIREGVPGTNVIPMNKGGSIVLGSATITLTNAFHSSSYDTKDGPVYAGEPCGIVVRFGQRSIYHAGDTCLFSDMQLIARTYAPQVAFLPIGDRFTMGPSEAAQALALIKPKLAIPIHYGTFPLLTGTVQEFKEKARGQESEIRELTVGERTELSW